MGKIRRQAGQVRVNVELIDASTRQNLWADMFDRPMSDIFAIQSEIAEKLAARLKVALSAETEEALAQAPTVDPVAYELVLRGRNLRKQETAESLGKAADLFEKATERDPDYALAWAGLAEVRSLLGMWYAAPESRPELLEKAAIAADRALELDDGLPEAHVSRGILLAYRAPYDLPAAERELRRAIELNPHLSNAHRELGLLLLRKMGRVEEGLEELIVTRELEPFWGHVKNRLIEAYLEKGDLVNAVKTTRQARELKDPSERLFRAAWTGGAFQDLGGAERFAREIIAGDANSNGLRWASLFLSLNGRTAEAASVVERLLERDSGTHLDHRAAAVVALFAGEYRAVVRHMTRAYELLGDAVGWNATGYSLLFIDDATLLGYAHLKMGDEESALRLFGETEQYYMDRISRGDTSLRARVGIAAVHALRGDREAAYDWLQQAIDAGFYQYAELERHPCFESLHGEERFQEMMAGVKVTVEEMRREVDAIEAEGS